MTVHQNNLESILPITVTDIDKQDDALLTDKAYCLVTTIGNELADISPLAIANITEPINDMISEKTCCVMATIDNDSVNVSPLVIAGISNPIDNRLTDKTYRVVETVKNDLFNVAPLIVTDIYDHIADALVDKGYYITPDLLPEAMTASLFQRVTLFNAEDFHTAGIGRKQTLQRNQQIRSDETRWLTVDNAIDSSYLDWMSNLRTELNQRLYMGLFKYEAHYAHYPPGAFYQRHVDAFKDESNRVLTTLLYLNPDWQIADGGALRIYHPETGVAIEEILPEYGTFIVFLSDQFPHQVLQTHRDRYSIAGWFHINNSL